MSKLFMTICLCMTGRRKCDQSLPSSQVSKMAASTAWRNRLKNHKIFEILAETNEKHDKSKYCHNRIAINDGEIYVWNPSSVSVFTTNLKDFVLEDDGNRGNYQVMYFIFYYSTISNVRIFF